MPVRFIGTEEPSPADAIRRSIDSGKVALPPMPQVATRVLKLLREDYDGPVGTIVDLVGSDAALTASIFRVANSALFGGLRAVSDMRFAIARLGVREVTSIVTVVSLRSQFSSTDPARQTYLHALWDHAVVSALAARRLAAAQGLDANETFLAGLLHDTGKLIILRAFDQLQSGPKGIVLSPEVRAELLDTLHPELGARVLTAWKLPETTCRAALRHHEPEMPIDDRLLICVRVGNAVSRKLGAHPHPTPDLSLLDLPEMEALNMGEVEIAVLMADIELDLAHLRQLL